MKQFAPDRRKARNVGVLAGLVVAMTLGLAGCASQPKGEAPMILRWPEAPLPTRIEYVTVIRGSRDLEGPPTFGDQFARFVGLDADANQIMVHPADIEVTPDGQVVYVSDFARGVVHVFDRLQKKARVIGEDQPFSRPFGLDLDSAGRIWLVEQGKQQIRVLDAEGRTERILQDPHFIRPVDLALDEARGRVYVADPSHQDSQEHYVRILDLEGNYLGELGSGRGTSEGNLLFPTYLAVDGDGNVYVSDTMNSRVSIFASDGSFQRTVGSRGDGFGLFDKPKGVAVDSFGNLYVVDSSWSNVQIFGPEGQVLLYFGGRGGYPGLLRNPTGIAIAQDTNTIFVADYLNRRVVIYQLVNTDADDSKPDDAEQEPEG
ncbi:MAG: hypothetical protein JRG83_02115 [Deltaproteobacteria bacterium]|nr:hypothetical protein [Deltaproteobacteria bacterium]